MGRNNDTKKSLRASALSILVCVAMLIGTTFAWFTDSVTNSGNKIESGNLDVTLEEYKDGSYQDVSKEPIFNYSKWEPGYTDIAAIKIGNNGSLALKYDVNFTAKETAGNKLAEVIDVYYLKNGQAPDMLPESFDDLTNKGFEKVGNLAQFLNSETPGATGHILPGEADYAIIALHMQESAGNDYQGLAIGEGFDIVVRATQYTHETDGFGNPDYDAEASTDVKFGTDIKDAMDDENVKEVIVGENIDLNQSVFQQPNGNATFEVKDGKILNLNGNKVIRPDHGSGNGLSIVSGATAIIENGTIFSEGDMSAVDIAEGSAATFRNIDFIGHGNEILKVRAKAGTNTTLVFENCTFENAPVTLKGRDGATNINVRFTNCSLSGTYKMYDEDGNELTDPHGNTHYTSYLLDAADSYLYGNITLENCKFDFDASENTRSKIPVIHAKGCNTEGHFLNVNLQDITVTGKGVIPVKVEKVYEDRVVVTESGTNNYTVDGVAVNYDGTAK